MVSGSAGAQLYSVVHSPAPAPSPSGTVAVMQRPHRILVGMCVLIAVNQLGFGGIVPVLALYARSFGVSQSAIGVAIAVYGLARFLVAMPVGRLADALGRRPALAIGGLVTAAGNLLCAYAPDFLTLVAGRFVAGAGAALVLIAGQIVLADISTPARRGRTMAIYQGVFLFAVGVGPLPGGLLAELYGLRAPFLAYAVAGVVAAALAWAFIPETKSVRSPGTSDAEPPLPPFGSQIRILTRHRGFMLVSLISFMNAVARTGALFNVIPILARDRLALSTDRIGLGLALASLVGLVVIYPSGVLVDRYGRKAVIVPATFVSGISLLLFLLAPSYAWFLAGCVAWSLATGVGGAAPAAYAADVAPPGMNAAAMSGFRMLADLGYVVGPISLGLATDLFGADAALGTTAVLLAATAWLFGRYAPELHRHGRL
jgi:DHA1 family multidrug resistance protein-like MFS transporter